MERSRRWVIDFIKYRVHKMIHIKYDGDDTIKLGLNFYSLNNKNSFGVVISWN